MTYKVKYNNDNRKGNRFLDLLEYISDYEFDKILTGIIHISERKGNPEPPTAKPLKNIKGEINEFTFNLKDKLIRINYFTDKEDESIVILNWYEKPDGRKNPNKYKSKKGNIDKVIKQSITEALELKKEYQLNKKCNNKLSYETYTI